jgi:branched-chain amino acid transport system ATP-binding protein
MSSVLIVEDLAISFGGVLAVGGVSFQARKGEILSIIGPNGAGKTTLFNMVSGLNKPHMGQVQLAGKDVTGYEPFRLARLGMSRTFQNLQIFSRLSVIENVMIGRSRWERTNVLADMLGLSSVHRQNAETRQAAYRILEKMGFADQADVIAGNLSYGALKRLEIARALASEPAVLLLDEPAAGCNAVETEEIVQVIKSIASTDVAIVLIEHDMKMVMRLSNHVVVLNGGRLLAEGPPDVVRNNPDVISAYLGTQRTENVAS